MHILFPEIERVTDAGGRSADHAGLCQAGKDNRRRAEAGLFIATLFIVYNTIRLTVFARRREIRTIQLVGAALHGSFDCHCFSKGCFTALLAQGSPVSLYSSLPGN